MTVAGVVGLTTVLAIASVWDDSVIVDEVPHIGAGYSYLVKKDMRLNPEHPPLAKDLAAIPLLFLNLNQEAFTTRFWQADVNGQWEFGRYLMFNSGPPSREASDGQGNDADQIKHWAKLPMLLFFILSAALVFAWANRLYGRAGAMIALTLFSFSPTVIAHWRFVTTDMRALFWVLFGTYFFLKYLRQPNRKNLIVSGAFVGIALLTKFSTFLILPYLGLLAAVYGFVKNAGGSFRAKIFCALRFALYAFLIFLIGFLIVVWPVYYFHIYDYPPARQHQDTQFLLGSFGNRPLAEAVVWMSDKPVIRAPAQYLLGLLMVVQRSAGGNTTYFLGEVSAAGWHSYFPVVYFIKEPLAWWALAAIALGANAAQTKNEKRRIKNLAAHFDEFAMLLWLAIYWATSIRSNLNIGVRHLLPIYPFAIILVSGQLTAISNKLISNKLRNRYIAYCLLLTALLGWFIFESLKVYPHYLTYFNQVVGGPSGGYRYVVDSNLDWGQDLLRLSKWVKQNGIQKIELDYFGWADPAYYLKDRYIWLNSTKYRDAADFVSRNQSGGWLAVSATFLQGSKGTPDNPSYPNYDDWLKAHQPVTVIGNSIFVYNLK